MHTKGNDGVAFTTVSDDKEEPKKGGKRKKSLALDVKNRALCSQCEGEFPPRTGKKGANMFILDERVL